MEIERLKQLYEKYSLTPDNYFKHSHYTIITRSGIDKIQAIEKIYIDYDVIKCEVNFCVVKANASKENAKIQTFGSAVYGGKEWDKSKKNGAGGWNEKGNTTSWYVMEIAEKRAMSRAVLKLTGFYELGVFGEDESEDFKPSVKITETTTQPIKTVDHSVKTLPYLEKDSKAWKGALKKGSELSALRKYFRVSKENAELYDKELIISTT